MMKAWRKATFIGTLTPISISMLNASENLLPTSATISLQGDSVLEVVVPLQGNCAVV